jgi:tRNA modification GTPase
VFSTSDTIVAIATPPGRGGIGVVRVSGPDAQRIASTLLTRDQPLEPRRATFTRVRIDNHSETPPTDDVVATFFAAPRSYTAEDVIEISAHGSPVVLHAIVRQAIEAGARLAQPGEFTLRAFLNGKINLVQAEAVADLIAAATPLQARVACDQLQGTMTTRIAALDAVLFDLIARLEASLDFPDEGYHFVEPSQVATLIGGVIGQLDELLVDARRGRVIREGVTVVIAGRANVGKSSIYNNLAGFDRAIVTPIAGTTRDLISERVDIGGLSVTLVDTAGTRETSDDIEREGVERGAKARAVADLVLLVLDRSEGLTPGDVALLADSPSVPRLVVANKCDQPERGPAIAADVSVSAITGAGIADLRSAIVRSLTRDESLRDTVPVSNARHIDLLRRARAHLENARTSASVEGTPEEIVLTDLQSARSCFDELVGARTPDDLLVHIFERFCIGK